MLLKIPGGRLVKNVSASTIEYDTMEKQDEKERVLELLSYVAQQMLEKQDSYQPELAQRVRCRIAASS